MKVRKRIALLAAGVLMALTAACGGSDNNTDTGGQGTQQGGQIIWGRETEFPENLNPLIAAGNSVATAYAIIRVAPSPTKYLPDFTVVHDPELLTARPTSEMKNSKQVVTYKLNPAAVWGDGDVLDAEDFIFSWQIQRSSDPADGGCADLLATTGYEQIETVEGKDGGKTVEVTFKTQYADWLYLFNQQLFPKHFMDKGDPKANCDNIRKGFATKDGYPLAATAGPWKIEASGVDVGKKILTLTRNDRYWGTKPTLDRLIMQTIGSEPGTNVKALKSGELQLIDPQPQLDLVRDVKALEPQVTSKTEFGLSFEHMDYNTTNKHLKDINVRKAIATALDRPSLVAATVAQFDNRATVLNSRFLVNNQPGYKDNSGGLYDRGDVPKAKQMLESAGYTLGPDGIYQKAGVGKLSLEMMTTQRNPLRENTVDVVASQLKAAGIQINKLLNPDIFAGKEKPKSLEARGFDIALFAWVSSPSQAGNLAIYQSATAASPKQNYVLCNDPKVDDLLSQMVQETDPAAQTDLANQSDAQLWQDMCTLPLYQKPNFMAHDSGYTGIVLNGTNSGDGWASEGWARKA